MAEKELPEVIISVAMGYDVIWQNINALTDRKLDINLKYTYFINNNIVEFVHVDYHTMEYLKTDISLQSYKRSKQWVTM